MFEAFGASVLVVALAEVGDKTQLLAIVLAAKYRKPVPVILGILAATLANHALAAGAGYYIAGWFTGPAFRIVVGAAFIVMAAWALIPDKADDAAVPRTYDRVFLTTLVAFFFVEIGDKTQIATSLLAARYHEVVAVTVGTTVGMMVANVPAVLFGEAITKIVPLHVVRIAAAVLFAAIGLCVVLDGMRVI
jgi:putative Ca2+/H+ antiporter (TMEM165/GDT1 family)